VLGTRVIVFAPSVLQWQQGLVLSCAESGPVAPVRNGAGVSIVASARAEGRGATAILPAEVESALVAVFATALLNWHLALVLAYAKALAIADVQFGADIAVIARDLVPLVHAPAFGITDVIAARFAIFTGSVVGQVLATRSRVAVVHSAIDPVVTRGNRLFVDQADPFRCPVFRLTEERSVADIVVVHGLAIRVVQAEAREPDEFLGRQEVPAAHATETGIIHCTDVSVVAGDGVVGVHALADGSAFVIGARIVIHA